MYREISGLPVQPAPDQREYQIGDEIWDGFVMAWADDKVLQEAIISAVEQSFPQVR